MTRAHRFDLWTIILALAWAVIAAVVIAAKVIPLTSGAAKAAVSLPTAGGAGASHDERSSALRVATFVVKPEPFAEKLRATGTLRADEAVELQADTTGKIVSINFDEGARIRAGALLVELNDARTIKVNTIVTRLSRS